MACSGECTKLGEELAQIVAEAVMEEGCDCLLYSGGIDTSFVLAAGREAGWMPRLVSTLFPGAADREFVLSTVEREGLDHVVFLASPGSPGVEACLERVLRVLKMIDPVEVAAGVASCLALELARRVGCRCIATGDAGDELFYGYDFLLDKNEEYLGGWLSWVLGKASYSSKPIGESLGLRVLHPLNTREAKKLAVEAPTRCKIGVSPRGERVGKLLMRCYLESRGWGEVAWRPKTPITRGSGVDALFAHWSSQAGLGEALEACRRDGIVLPSLSHVYLYRRYRSLGLPLPPRCPEETRGCPFCGACMTDRGYCRFCGAVVLGGGEVSFHGGGAPILDEVRRSCGGRL